MKIFQYSSSAFLLKSRVNAGEERYQGNLLLITVRMKIIFFRSRGILKRVCLSQKQYTLLMCAARGSNVNVVEYLAETVESLNGDATDCTGATALHHAASAGHPTVITALSDISRIELNAIDKVRENASFRFEKSSVSNPYRSKINSCSTFHVQHHRSTVTNCAKLRPTKR